MARIALLAGATGLIGSQVLHLLLQDNYYDTVIAISRTPLSVTNPKLENLLMTVSDWNKLQSIRADDIFCCLGTTMKQAGSKEAFRSIDYEYPIQLAKHQVAQGATSFLLVSALGANAKSSIFYNRVKGEVEREIISQGYRSTYIFRPSLLLGSRKESRPGEDSAKMIYSIFGWLIPKKYKAIESVKVARAMLAQAKSQQPGLHIYESAELQGY